MRRVRAGAGWAAWAALALVAACDGGAGAPDDEGSDLAIIITPDPGRVDPGAEPGTDPGTTDPGGQKDPGNDLRDPGFDPGGDDPGWDPGEWDPGWDPGGWDPGGTDPGCTPDCSGKQCGSNGCGGTCGTCTKPATCLGGQCQCMPNCGQSTCGDDGCGGQCGTGTCPADRPCTDELTRHCAQVGPCKRTTTIACADLSKSANNGDTNSNGDLLDVYPAACGDAKTPGPEKAFKFVADQSGHVIFTLSSQPAFLNLYLLEGGTCTASACTRWSHDAIDLDAVAGTTYFVVVDATVNNNSLSASLAIDCDWYVPPVDN